MKSPVIFRVFKNNQIHFVKQFTDKDQLVIGRSDSGEAEVDVDLDSNEVSSIHCLVEKRGTQFYICDLGSAQGTFKNGQTVLDEPIASGEEFSVGPFKIVFFVGVPKPVHSENSSQISISAEKPTEKPKAESAVAPLVHIPAPNETTTTKDSAAKPSIQAAFVGQKLNARAQQFLKQKKSTGEKTFAPNSDRKGLSEFIKPGSGAVVEIVVSWKERILNSHHLNPQGQYKAGPSETIQLPDGAVPKNWVLIDCTNGVQIRLAPEMKCESHRSDSVKEIKDSSYRLQQNEVVFIHLVNGMQIAVRYSAKTALVPLDSSLIFSASEFTGILAALIIATLTSLIVSVLTPKNVPVDEEVQRVAQVVFNRPPVEIKTPPPVTPVEKPTEKPPVPPKKIEPPKKIVEANKQEEKKLKGDVTKPEAKSQAAEKAGRASEVKPKDPKLKTKIFTSTKQGGAVKTGDKAGANAQSKDIDPTNAGLLSAFGSGGVRSKLDKAYSGSGELIGDAGKATGASGFNENRAGGDVGSKFKDTGAGGKGTATSGISGIGTKGRGNGTSAYGSGDGFGSKDQVAISAGGAEEEFVGTIDREAVRRVVRSALTQFKDCYNREYKSDTKLEGKVVITWEIHEKGIAKNARIVSSTIKNSNVESCVKSRMMTLRFPEPPAGTVAEVTYPFLFQGQK